MAEAPIAQQGTKVKVLWDFQASDADELTLEENDVLTLTGAADGAWWEGELNGNVGWFPSNYVEIATGDPEDDNETGPSTIENFSGSKDEAAISAEKNRAWYKMYKSKPKQADDKAKSSEKPTPAKVEEPAAPVAAEADKKESFRVVSRVVTSSSMSPPKWSDDIDGMILGRLSDKERKRQEVIFELLQTERDYVRDLDIIVDIYLNPLRKSKIISPKDLATLFSNIESLQPVNLELLRLLEDRREIYQIIPQVGDIFIRVSDYLKMYNMYCSNQPYAISKLDSIKTKQFKAFLNEARSRPECRSLDLGSFLIKPVQRICKYPLLLREIIKQTDEKHDDRAELDEAFRKIEMVVTIVNEASRQAEAAQKMLVLQNKFVDKIEIIAPSRQMIKDLAVIHVVDGKEKDRRHIYLFNDLLILCKSPKGNNEKLHMIAYIPLDVLIVSPAEGLGIELTHVANNKHLIRVSDVIIKKSLVEEMQALAEDERDRKEQERQYDEDELEPYDGLMSEEEYEQMEQGGAAEPEPEPEPEPPAPVVATPQTMLSDNQEKKTTNKSQEKNPSPASTPPVQRTSSDATTPKVSTAQGPQPAASGSATPATPATPTTGGQITPGKKTAFLAEQERAQNQLSEFQSKTQGLRKTQVFVDPAEKPPTPAALEPEQRLNNLRSNLRQSKAYDETKRTSSDEQPEFLKVKEKLRQTRAYDTESTTSGTEKDQSTPATPLTTPPPQRGGGGGFCCGGSRRPPEPTPMQSVAADNKAPITSQPATASIPTTATKTTVAATSTPTPASNTKASTTNQARTSSTGPTATAATGAGTKGPARVEAQQSALVAGQLKPVIRATVKDHRRLDEKKNDAYVYIVEVVREDNMMYLMQKTYDDFYTFHFALITQFREEAGSTGKPRVIPDLPAQPFNVSESMATVLQRGLDRYIRAIFRLPEKISKSIALQQFLKYDPKLTVQMIKAGGPTPAVGTVATSTGPTGHAAAKAGATASTSTGTTANKGATPASPAAAVTKQPPPASMVVQDRDAPQVYSGPVGGPKVGKLAQSRFSSAGSQSETSTTGGGMAVSSQPKENPVTGPKVKDLVQSRFSVADSNSTSTSTTPTSAVPEKPRESIVQARMSAFSQPNNGLPASTVKKFQSNRSLAPAAGYRYRELPQKPERPDRPTRGPLANKSALP